MVLPGKCLLFSGTVWPRQDRREETPAGSPPAFWCLLVSFPTVWTAASGKTLSVPPGGHQTGPLSPSLSEGSGPVSVASRGRHVTTESRWPGPRRLWSWGPPLGFLRTPLIGGERQNSEKLTRRGSIPFCILSLKFSSQVKGPLMKSVVLSLRLTCSPTEPTAKLNCPGS